MSLGFDFQREWEFRNQVPNNKTKPCNFPYRDSGLDGSRWSIHDNQDVRHSPSSPTSSMVLALRPLASISPSSTPFLNSSGIFFQSSPNPPELAARFPASRLICASLEGPSTNTPAMAIRTSSAGPRPKNEGSVVDERRWVMGG